MATGERDNQSDKKFEITQSVSGMDMDNSLNQVKKGKVTYALNAVVENFSGDSINYQNELGNTKCAEFPEGYLLVGSRYIPERDMHLVMLANESNGLSQIGKIVECEYSTIAISSCLGFSTKHPIHKIVYRIQDGEIEIYWTDNIARRYINIDDVPKVLRDGSKFCNPVYEDVLDCNKIKVQPMFEIPVVSVDSVTEGGQIETGVYQFAVQYCDALGNGFSSFYSVTNPTPIADPTQITVNFDNKINKSINVSVTNLDPTGLFSYFNLAVIATVNGISTVRLVGTYDVDSEGKTVAFTGQFTKNLSIEDIFKKNPYYGKAKDITVVQDILVWDQLYEAERINYQKIANKIKLEWQAYRIPKGDNGYANSENASNLVGYTRDEVYPFEIIFITRDGRESDRMHIPGRTISQYEKQLPDITSDNPDYIGTNGEPLPYWRNYNTASVIGLLHPSTPTEDYKGPWMFGDFGYWESEEEYPCNVELWGELAGQKIRHHRFPDVSVCPIFENGAFETIDGMDMEERAIFTLGVKIDPKQIEFLIETSDLTREEKDNIAGYKIIRGDRSTNKSVIAKGLIRNVGKYERGGQEYFFPNYPYNDLSKDPFLNSLNNAFEAICQPFDIDVTAAPAEIEYVDCNTNKQQKKKYSVAGKYQICSVIKPTILSGTATSSYATYEVWRVKSEALGGLRVQWEDISKGITDMWVSGGIFNMNLGGPPSYINVKQGTTPQVIDGTSNYTLFRYSNVFSDFACGKSEPLDTYRSVGDRMVFNSPETSFGNPSLGSVVKMEAVLFGKGKAHFTEVRDNAKYKLLTREAQLDALKSSAEIGAITDPFGSDAFFTAFNSYVTMYINNMTSRNFAYSFNSIANYSYYRTVPENQGVKQRKLDIARYLIPGVQNIGDDFNINNYQRETSVFLKTLSDNLPFADRSPNMLFNALPLIEDKSRFTVSEIGTCGSPEKEEDIKVVAYYASIKNNNRNQWGQIYSYETVDTGYFNLIGGNNTSVFGGDTFIGRFAFKTKLPFFIDNRVNAPDGSDIFYDEIGNVAYPKYWHSSRSILENYSVPGVGVLANVLSYKAHNFDCPNSQGGESETDAAGRTYYDGLFYLFAYGIPYFYCESSYNLDLRQAFNNKEGDYFPRVSTGIPDDWLQERNVSIQNDNTYYYNQSFSKQNKESFFSVLPVDWTKDEINVDNMFRAIFSEKRTPGSSNRVNNWLIYKPLSTFDFPQNYGDLISLENVGDRQVLARFRNRSLLYNSMVTLDVSVGQLYLGQSLFDSNVPPLDFGDTESGFMGTQHVFFLKTPYGSITVDAKRGQIFIVAGTKITELSSGQFTMERFFSENLPFRITSYFPDVNIDNHFNGVGIHGVYDHEYDRFILTKIDYEPLSEGVKYDPESEVFYVEESYGTGLKFRRVVQLTDPTQFANRSWSLSFNFKIMSWVSFHSYIPNWYMPSTKGFLSGSNVCCDEMEGFAMDSYHDPSVSTTTTTTIPTTSTTTTKAPGISTTTTTTTIRDCDFDVEVTPMDCNVGDFIGWIITPSPEPVCKRPSMELLSDVYFLLSYTIVSGPTVIDPTVSQEAACEAIEYLKTVDIGDVTIETLRGQVEALFQGATVYLWNDTDDCEKVPDGYYVTDESFATGFVYHVVDGIVVGVEACIPPTTTTTTTLVSTTTTTTTEGCGCADLVVVVAQGDLDDSTGNTVPFSNGTMYYQYVNCEGNMVTTQFSASGTYTVCGELYSMNSAYLYYMKNNAPVVPTYSSETPTLNACCS